MKNPSKSSDQLVSYPNRYCLETFDNTYIVHPTGWFRLSIFAIWTWFWWDYCLFQITMRKRPRRTKSTMTRLHWASVPLKLCHPGWERLTWTLISNRTQNLLFCEETNTSSGYGTTHQNSSRSSEEIENTIGKNDRIYTYCDLLQNDFCVHNFASCLQFFCCWKTFFIVLIHSLYRLHTSSESFDQNSLVSLLLRCNTV